MRKLQYILFFSSFFNFHLVQMNLTCYDCDPSSVGSCRNPERNNIKLTRCEQLENATSGITNQCFSIQYQSHHSGKHQPGVYRGCIARPRDQHSCDHIKDLLTDGKVTWCHTCSENRCNTAAPWS